MKPGPLRAVLIGLAGAILLGSCSAPRPNGQITLQPGAAWREVVKAGGKPTVKFSYVTAGRKYDLATMEN